MAGTNQTASYNAGGAVIYISVNEADVRVDEITIISSRAARAQRITH